MAFKKGRGAPRLKARRAKAKKVVSRKPTFSSSIATLSRKVSKLSKTMETKSGVIQIADGTEYGHNAINVVNNNFSGTLSRIMDSENSRGTRIGYQINLVGVTVAMMLELNERYSDVTFCLMVVRSAKNDTPNNDK